MTSFDAERLLFQKGTDPLEGGAPPPQRAVIEDLGMRIERNRAVTMSDGVEIYVDLFLPRNLPNPIPALVAWGPYGKHNGGNVYQQFKDESGTLGGGVDPAWISPYTTFEGPDPKQWCALGYAVINVDPRGTWWSGGEFASIWDEREARDAADLIAWAADEPWSNGKVGMTGVSYLAVAQWWAASIRPPALAAINPCEGLSNVYREFSFHGGIPSEFPLFWQTHRLKYSVSKIEALAHMMATNTLEDEYWLSKAPVLEDIDVPAFVIASWSDQGLHTRGTLEAFDRIGSTDKYLEIHGRKKWEYYHQPSTVARQKLFFDRYLKGVDNEVDRWPRVRMEIRDSFYSGYEATADTWPLVETSRTVLHLDAASRALTTEPAGDTAAARYGSDDGEVVFDHVFDRPTDIVGAVRRHLWVEAESANDLDLFVALKKVNSAGELVDFAYANVLEHGPVALGWLRASRRELDASLSRDDRPWHTHTHDQPVVPGTPVDVDVEIWPSGTRFEAGDTLRLIIRGTDVYPGAALWRHIDTRNSGAHIVRTGGEFDSYLVVPTLPAAELTRWASPDV
jgi:predicted acyl esterase